MWSWIRNNTDIIDAGLNGAMVLIWFVYLQIFFVIFRRANRSMIHIGMLATEDEDARCLVTNMGSDAVYLVAVVIDLECGDATYQTLVTDRIEVAKDQVSSLRQRSNQGPLKAGEAIDIGSFRDLTERAALKLGRGIDASSCAAITITAAVATHQDLRVKGGYKRFDIDNGSKGSTFSSPDLHTRQSARHGAAGDWHVSSLDDPHAAATAAR